MKLNSSNLSPSPVTSVAARQKKNTININISSNMAGHIIFIADQVIIHSFFLHGYIICGETVEPKLELISCYRKKIKYWHFYLLQISKLIFIVSNLYFDDDQMLKRAISRWALVFKRVSTVTLDKCNASLLYKVLISCKTHTYSDPQMLRIILLL